MNIYDPQPPFVYATLETGVPSVRAEFLENFTPDPIRYQDLLLNSREDFDLSRSSQFHYDISVTDAGVIIREV